jgi:hypothetical protein
MIVKAKLRAIEPLMNGGSKSPALRRHLEGGGEPHQQRPNIIAVY